MSAFNLEKYVPSLGKRIPLECVFQAGKVFENGGPYSDLLNVSSRDAKRDERLRMSGRIISFEFEGNRFPTKPKTLFYDWLYINARIENIDVAKAVFRIKEKETEMRSEKKNVQDASSMSAVLNESALEAAYTITHGNSYF